MKKLKLFIILIILFDLFVCGIILHTKTYAGEMPVPVNIQFTLFMKILTYDRNLKTKAGNELKIGVVFTSDADSKKAKDEFVEALKSFAGKTVAGLPASCVEIPFTSADALLSSIKDNGISVIYIAPGNSNNISAITQASQSSKILTITGVPDYVEKGLSVGIGLKADDNKPEIIINLPITKAEGSDFDANLLKLARVIK